jgi:hypothetical protein
MLKIKKRLEARSPGKLPFLMLFIRSKTIECKMQSGKDID